MSYELAKLGAYLISPLTVVLGLALFAGLCLAAGRRRLALASAALSFGCLWIASTPAVAQALNAALRRDYPALTLDATPAADAILVLGGALVPADPPRQPYSIPGGEAARVWHAARLYRAGKASWIVVAAGNQPGQPGRQAEAAAIAEMLTSLGVPPEAIRPESASRNTRENAANVHGLLAGLGVRRVLLVTSGQHMARAMKTFEKVWAHSPIAVAPSPPDGYSPRPFTEPSLWIPSPFGLLDVTKCLKEFAGMAALVMI